MADRYIDLDETQIYGPYSAKMIRRFAVGQIPAFDAGMYHVAGEIEHGTAEIKRRIEASRAAGAAIREGAGGKGPVLDRGIRYLGRFSTHLDSEPKGQSDRRTFFPEDGTAGGVGRSAARVLIAIGRIEEQLAKPECRATSKAEWLAEATALRAELTPVVEHSSNARTERTTATPELEAVRQAWLHTYVAAKCGVECVLRLAGKLHLM
ncbi:MAG: hypothetical protein HY906_11425, partial [Deltaproteobacteria bacterium]|nr:hypothetical protein [Deltaproteobacteria bacterium]